MNWLASRLSEPSTHAALAAVLTAAVPLFGPYAGVAAAVFAVLGFVMPEKAK